MDSLADIFKQQEEQDRQRAKAMVSAQIRNAITAIEEGDEDEAIGILKNLIGEE